MTKLPAGISNDRLRHQSNAIERRFVQAWRAEHQRSRPLLDILLTHQHGDPSDWEPDVVSDRDRVVAETVIQWLGSNVGLGFLEDVLGVRRIEDRRTIATRAQRWDYALNGCRHPKDERRPVKLCETYSGKELWGGEQCGRCLRIRWDLGRKFTDTPPKAESVS